MNVKKIHSKDVKKNNIYYIYERFTTTRDHLLLKIKALGNGDFIPLEVTIGNKNYYKNAIRNGLKDSFYFDEYVYIIENPTKEGIEKLALALLL